MRVLFINNQIDNRGTGNALFDYAHYNETILGNESIILSLDMSPRNPLMEQRLINRFGTIFTVESAGNWSHMDTAYHIKSGRQGFGVYGSVPYAVHAVFEPTEPHGARYATISRWMGEKYNVPYVPHIVNKNYPQRDWKEYAYLRAACGIPPRAIVFGRHGGHDTFDIPWAWGAMWQAVKYNPDIYFLFMGTDKPDLELNDHFIFLPETSDEYGKIVFIRSCDAMIHARWRGETYGMAVGEFAVEGKPVLTYSESPEKAHIDMLGEMGVLYSDQESLTDEIMNISQRPWLLTYSDYLNHTPEKVMAQFKGVFL